MGWLNSIAARVAAGFLVISAIIAWATVETRARQQALLERVVRDAVSAETKRHAQHLAQLLDLRMAQLGVIAHSRGIGRALATPGDTGEARARMALARSTVGTIDLLCLFDAAGNLVTSSGVGECSAGALVGSRFEVEEGRLEDWAGIAVGQGEGSLVAKFRPDLVEQELSASDFVASVAETYLIDERGRLLTPGMARQLPAGAQDLSGPLPQGWVMQTERVGGWPVSVRTVVDIAALTRVHAGQGYAILAAGLLALLAIGGVLAVAVRSVTRPMGAVRMAAETIARGDFRARVPEAGPLEARALAQAINTMAQGLERAYLELEDQVLERTREMLTAVDRARELQHLAESQSEELTAQNEELQAQTAELALHQQTLSQRNELLAEKNRELEHASRLKSEFVANMSHELRTPLNAVIGFSELLEQGLGGSLSAEQREYVGDIHTAGQHLLAMINDILDVAKVEAGKMHLEHLPVELALPVREAEQIVRPLVARKQLRLDLELDPAVRVLGDGQRLRQVVLNLLSNAVKFTPPEGRIQVTVRADRHRQQAELWVKDSGIGIDPAHHETVFEAFRQVDGSFSRNFEGTGLGLTLVRRFVTAMDGTVSLDSRLGEGATFTLRFPLLDAPSEAEATPAGQPQPTEKLDVLVVEDDSSARGLVERLLERHGHRVESASDGAEALERLRQHLPGVMVLDLMMPRVSGLEVLERLRQLPHGDEVAVLVLSAKEPWGAEADRLEALGAKIALKGALHSAQFAEVISQLGARRPAEGRA